MGGPTVGNRWEWVDRKRLAAMVAVLSASGSQAARAASTPTLVRSESVYVAPLGTPSLGAPGAASASLTGPVTLPLPSGNVAGFGSAVATVNTGNYEYVVVGAPGAARAFVYKKALTSGSFSGPVELIGSGGLFGAAVAIRWGTIAVGAPGSGAVQMFSQPRDGNGYPLEDDARGFQLSPNQPHPFLTDGTFGRSIALAPTVDGPVVVCGTVCQNFYQRWQNGFPTGTSSSDLGWTQTGPTPPGDSAYASAIGALAVVNPASNPNPNTVSIYNSAGPYFYSTAAQATFGPPAGGTFTGEVVGSYDRLLMGVSSPGNGTQFFTYSASSLSPLTWAQSVNPVFTLPPVGMGRTMATNTDTWLTSNTDGTSPAGAATVYRITLDRHGTFYDYSDDTWSQELIASGTSTFGTGLALSTSFYVIGDPGLAQATAYGNDLQLMRNMYSSQPTGVATVTFTTVVGSPPPIIQEYSDCSNMPSTVFQPPSKLGPCIHVTPNAPLIGAATVCYPNPHPDPNHPVYIARCAESLPTTPPSCSGTDVLIQAHCCSLLVNQSTTANPLCGDTDHFSDVAAGVLTDTDGDLIPDISDNCPTVQNINQADSDGDGVGDACDNCLAVFNLDQKNTTGAPAGDACNCALPGVKFGPTGVACPAKPVPLPRSAVAICGIALLAFGVVALGKIRSGPFRNRL
jgi:hypothetical protein